MTRGPDEVAGRPQRIVLRWFLAAVAASFVAGLGAGGLLVRIADRSAAEPSDRNAAIVRHYAERYDLSREQVRQVRMVLAAKDAELQEILSSNRGLLPGPVQKKVGAVDLVAEERIKSVLNEAQRRRFLQDSTLRPADERRRDVIPKED